MNSITKAGIGITSIGMAFVLPYIDLLGMNFGAVNTYLLLVVQIGMVIVGLGLVVDE